MRIGKNSKRKSKLNNKGYSLMELIAVIAIMVIISTGVVSIFLSISSARVNECANDILGALKETRTDAMSKSSSYMYLEKDASSGKFVIKQTGKSDVLIGDSSTTIKVSYITDDGSSTGSFPLEASSPLILTYNRSSGAFMPMIESVSGSTVTYRTVSAPDSSDKYIYCTGIEITRNDKKKEIVLVKDTGKAYIKND